ncbi:hypothetical protein G7Z17_g4549 [Cylindrodendrum hubeiense]|uniref:Uncharacterized protein n=1 Tax=Cylindrodendrum hubeiense TaxID=595255 RepID=A0A9P5HIX1_9HYPO|nr:hypothetical protein G7Z17_g4549 [Cylindrodendrum hubeiense]
MGSPVHQNHVSDALIPVTLTLSQVSHAVARKPAVSERARICTNGIMEPELTSRWLLEMTVFFWEGNSYADHVQGMRPHERISLESEKAVLEDQLSHLEHAYQLQRGRAEQEVNELKALLDDRNETLDALRQSLYQSQRKAEQLQLDLTAARSQEALADELQARMEQIFHGRTDNEAPENAQSRQTQPSLEHGQARAKLAANSNAALGIRQNDDDDDDDDQEQHHNKDTMVAMERERDEAHVLCKELQAALDHTTRVKGELGTELEKERVGARALQASLAKLQPKDTGLKRLCISTPEKNTSTISKLFTYLADQAESLHVIDDRHFDLLGVTTAMAATLNNDVTCRHLHRFRCEGPMNKWVCYQRVEDYGPRAEECSRNESRRLECVKHDGQCMFIKVVWHGGEKKFEFRNCPRISRTQKD